MADDDKKDKKVELPSWLGKPIVDAAHVGDLEQRAAINEFHSKMPRSQAEKHAHEDYVKEQREKAAAHHLEGMKASMATANHEDARKHWALYDLHLKALGKESVGSVPPEIEKRMSEEGKKHIYKFKAHKGDLYALHQAHEPVAEPMAKAMEDELEKSDEKLQHSPEDKAALDRVNRDYAFHEQKHHWAKTPHERDTHKGHMKRLRTEKLAIKAKTRAMMRAAGAMDVQKSEASRCKWRLGERRCQRMVTAEYCHDHKDHWANKIKQKEPAPEAAPVEKSDRERLESLYKVATVLEFLAKAQILKFPGNTAPAVDQGAPAPVTALPAGRHPAQVHRGPSSGTSAVVKPHSPTDVGNVLMGHSSRALDDEEDYEAVKNGLAQHYGVHPNVIDQELGNHTSRAMDDDEDLGHVALEMSRHLANHFGSSKKK